MCTRGVRGSYGAHAKAPVVTNGQLIAGWKSESLLTSRKGNLTAQGESPALESIENLLIFLTLVPEKNQKYILHRLFGEPNDFSPSVSEAPLYFSEGKYTLNCLFSSYHKPSYSLLFYGSNFVLAED